MSHMSSPHKHHHKGILLLYLPTYRPALTKNQRGRINSEVQPRTLTGDSSCNGFGPDVSAPCSPSTSPADAVSPRRTPPRGSVSTTPHSGPAAVSPAPTPTLVQRGQRQLDNDNGGRHHRSVSVAVVWRKS